MTRYYANIIDNKLNGKSQCIMTTTNGFQIEITENVYNNLERYEYKNGQLVEIEDYDEKQRKAKRKQEILARLDEIDLKCIRCLRAGETDRIQAYEEECIALREELKELG